MRIEIENKNIKNQLGIDIHSAIGSSMISATATNTNSVNDATIVALEVEINKLSKQQSRFYLKDIGEIPREISGSTSRM